MYARVTCRNRLLRMFEGSAELRRSWKRRRIKDRMRIRTRKDSNCLGDTHTVMKLILFRFQNLKELGLERQKMVLQAVDAMYGDVMDVMKWFVTMRMNVQILQSMKFVNVVLRRRRGTGRPDGPWM